MGWLLGLLAPVITDASRRQREKKKVAAALEAELGLLRSRLAANVYTLTLRVGDLNKETVTWAADAVSRYAQALGIEELAT